jgi:citrate lyase subunit beta/citryl-CoA lyase
MAVPSRPRRSMLYMPASNPRALEKAKTLPADGLIFDLEDAVLPENKPAARTAAVAAANSRAYGRREVLIRANALDTPWGKEDLAAIAASAADGVVLPKIYGPEDVRTAVGIIAQAKESFGLWLMMETPRAILSAAAIAAASPRIAGLCVGTADLAKDLHCAHTPDRATMLYSLQVCILAARAHGLVVLDGIHLELDDEAAFAAACRQGRDLGFDGKTLIHPKQIETANRAFAPSAEDIAQARRIVAAHREGAAQGKGMTTLDGRLVEKLHVIEAERLVAQAEAIEALAAS